MLSAQLWALCDDTQALPGWAIDETKLLMLSYYLAYLLGLLYHTMVIGGCQAHL